MHTAAPSYPLTAWLICELTAGLGSVCAQQVPVGSTTRTTTIQTTTPNLQPHLVQGNKMIYRFLAAPWKYFFLPMFNHLYLTGRNWKEHLWMHVDAHSNNLGACSVLGKTYTYFVLLTSMQILLIASSNRARLMLISCGISRHLHPWCSHMVDCVLGKSPRSRTIFGTGEEQFLLRFWHWWGEKNDFCKIWNSKMKNVNLKNEIWYLFIYFHYFYTACL